MSKYEYDDKNYYDELDKVVYNSKSLLEKLNSSKNIKKEERFILIGAIEVLLELYKSKI
jgi:hypothetical protein